ncbi:MAG: twin-arginine translocation signal domain-containing protein [Chloroflexi bacterium]|nr:twin-arginine translocation signal domain-containing protein [Chloroflexota bacterium]
MEGLPRRLASRREFLRLCGGTGVALGFARLLRPDSSEAASDQWVDRGPFPADDSYYSTVFHTPSPFNAVSISWLAKTPGSGNLAFRLRSSEDGVRWSSWTAAERECG